MMKERKKRNGKGITWETRGRERVANEPQTVTDTFRASRGQFRASNIKLTSRAGVRSTFITIGI
jgi:hypothetical protein